MNQIPRLIITAPASGSGKSVIASGIMAALSKKFPVQGYKVGPDYIDPMYHTAATGRASRNLDTWMLSPERVKDIFIRASEAASLNIIEGVMGLFDGYGSDPFLGSTANLACLLKAPVVLVIDCSKMSGSAAALVHGYHTFCNSLPLAGVICNRVGSHQHGQWLIEAIEKHNGIPVLGCVPRLSALQIPERHLGLFTVAERPNAIKAFLEQAGEVLSEHIDLERLVKIANQVDRLPDLPIRRPTQFAPSVRLAVARDEAFCFYYEDNLDALRRAGAEIIPFSPLKDRHLPPAISGIYLGGGYPELYGAQLSANLSLREEIRDAHQHAMPIYAECGGLMYLTEGIHLTDGDYPMVGLLPGWCTMRTRLRMGYRSIETLKTGLLGAAGLNLRGHEFHYSQWESPAREQAIYRVSPRNISESSCTDGYSNGNIHASYIHLHFGQDDRLAESLVHACIDWKNN